MIGAVSSFRPAVAFKADIQPDMLSRPGTFTRPDAPVEKKKSGSGFGKLLTVVVLAAAAALGLGWAVKNGKLAKVEVPEGFMAKAKNLGAKVGEWTNGITAKIAGWCGKGKAVADEVVEVAEVVAEGAAKA